MWEHCVVLVVLTWTCGIDGILIPIYENDLCFALSLILEWSHSSVHCNEMKYEIQILRYLNVTREVGLWPRQLRSAREAKRQQHHLNDPS